MTEYKNRLVRTKFVGGPEDGNYLMVYDYADIWYVERKTEPKATPCGAGLPRIYVPYLFTYVRRGAEMVIA